MYCMKALFAAGGRMGSRKEERRRKKGEEAKEKGFETASAAVCEI